MSEITKILEDIDTTKEEIAEALRGRLKSECSKKVTGKEA